MIFYNDSFFEQFPNFSKGFMKVNPKHFFFISFYDILGKYQE